MDTGLIVGKFFPFHKGHLELIKYGKENCQKLIVLMCLEDRFQYPKNYFENISQELKELDSSIIFKVLPEKSYLKYSYSDQDEEVSRAWARAIFENIRHMSHTGFHLNPRELGQAFITKVNKVFSSEVYGDNFAKHLGAEHIVFELERETISISGTQIREDLISNWDYLTDSSKKSFQRRLVVTGIEGSGKTTFIKTLSEILKPSLVVPEYGAQYCKEFKYPETEDEFEYIRKTQGYLEQVISNQLTPFVICDTNWLTTDSYESFSRGFTDSELKNHPDLYLLLTKVKDGFSTYQSRLPERERLVLKGILESKVRNSGIPILEEKAFSLDKLKELLTYKFIKDE